MDTVMRAYVVVAKPSVDDLKAAITARWEGQAVPDTFEVDDIACLFPEPAAPPEAAP